MFNSVVSTQDLLSDSQRTSYSSDSALFSLSQRQQSQNEFSQVRTQDMFTQNQMSGSQSESSFPPTRKMSMYDKWTSKGALLKKDQTAATQSKTSTTSQFSFQQQCPQNVYSKTRDTDERELLQQVISIVQDCNREVKCTLTAVKEKLESKSDFSGEKLSDIMTAFLEDIWKHEDRMMQVIEKQQETGSKINELEKQLAVKEVELKQLQSQLEEKGQPETLKQMAKAVRQEMLSPHLAVENKLMEILDVTRETSEQQTEHLNQYKSQMKAQAKQYSDWKAFNQRLIKDVEKRLQQDIASLRKDLKNREQEWQYSLQEQWTEACAVCTKDMEKFMEGAVSEVLANSSKHGMSSTTAAHNFAASLRKEMQGVLQKQTKLIEKNLRDMLRHQDQKQQLEVQRFHQTFLADVTARIDSAINDCYKKETDELLTPLSVPVFEEKIEEYHADLKQQLTEMHEKHVQEVKSIQNELQQQTFPPLAHSQVCRSFPFSAVDHVPRNTGYQLQRSKEMARISPLSKEERSTLFCSSKPSPVAAVLPQQKHAQETASLESLTTSDSEVSFHPQSLLPAGHDKNVKPGKKRRKSHEKKKHCSKGKKINLCKSKCKAVCKKSSKHAVEEAKAMQVHGHSSSVYDFSEEQNLDHNQQPNYDYHLQRSQCKRFHVCSPAQSAVSGMSSPAVSIIADKEVVLVRRSRWQICSTSKRAIRTGTEEVIDMLSSPSMAGQMLHNLIPTQEVQMPKRELRTRSGVKRP